MTRMTPEGLSTELTIKRLCGFASYCVNLFVFCASGHWPAKR